MPRHPHHPSAGIKPDALRRCFELGEDAEYVSKEIEYSVPAYISRDGHTWKKEGQVLCQPGRRYKENHWFPGRYQNFRHPQMLHDFKIRWISYRWKSIYSTKQSMYKKRPGTDIRELSNREKAVIVNALKENYPLQLLLHEFDLPGSSYFYQISAIRQPNKYAGLRTQMRKIFHENRDCYGYQRIWHKLQDRGIIISEKIILRIMKEEGPAVSSVKHKKYNSYQGRSAKRWNIS